VRRHIFRITSIAAVVALASCSKSGDRAAGTSVSTTDRPGQLAFSLSGVTYTFTLPEGYAIVSGRDAEVAEAVASLDPRNMTHFTIIPSGETGREGGFTRWAGLKTPRASLGRRIPTRRQWIEDTKRIVTRRDVAERFEDAKRLAEKTYQDVFGDDAKIGTHIEMVDADEYAGYMVGTVSIEVAGQKEVRAVAGGMTVVRGNAFNYYKYGPYGDPSDLAVLLKEVRSEIRRFVADNPD